MNNQVLNNMETTATNIFELAGQYVWILVGFALLVCFGLYIIGGEEGKQRANRWVPRIAIGTGGIVCLVSLAQWLSSIFSV